MTGSGTQADPYIIDLQAMNNEESNGNFSFCCGSH